MRFLRVFTLEIPRSLVKGISNNPKHLLKLQLLLLRRRRQNLA